jgi:glycerate 2-kinase
MNRAAHTAARQHLEASFRAALAAVDGRTVVRQYLAEHPPSGDVAVIAIGKAAAAMLAGARETLGGRLAGALLISKAGHFDASLAQDARITCLQGGHPLPDAHSLTAGTRLLQFLTGLPAGLPVLFLLSGGASSLVEVLPDGVSLELLRRANRWLLGSGLDIRAMNRVRQALSALKGGRLLAWLDDRPARALLISDVPGDDPAIIGSGPLYPQPGRATELPDLPDWLVLPATTDVQHMPGRIPHHVVASLAGALQAGADCARTLGYPARVMREPLAGPAETAARRIVRQLRASAPGICLWGGETTVVLPEQPGKGGRNQHLALAAALALQGHPAILLLAAGTDGDDGSTPAAGAIVDSLTVSRAAARGFDAAGSLRRADAGSCLAAAGDVLVTGPTGTNVMDMVIGLRLPD